MRFKDSILFALVVLVIVSESRDTSQSANRYFKGCGSFESKGQIQIYRPNGLRVTQNSKNLIAFGLEAYVYSNKSKYRTYWLHTTEVDPISNNFTVYEPMAVIRGGESFAYLIKKQLENGTTFWYDCKTFRVNEKLIKPTPSILTGTSNHATKIDDNERSIQSQTVPLNTSHDTTNLELVNNSHNEGTQIETSISAGENITPNRMRTNLLNNIQHPDSIKSSEITSKEDTDYESTSFLFEE